jgi:glutamate-1-semialdehyde 2,1-aminomutase
LFAPLRKGTHEFAPTTSTMKTSVSQQQPARNLAWAQRFLAGGVDSPVRAGKPVGEPSPFIVSGKGSRVTDVDGRQYIDYLCAYGPVILGHADRRVTHAVDSAMRRGAVVGTTHPEELRLAERISARFSTMERVRFVSTGTEACMSAVRVARAFTRREKIVRFAGCYHGQSDQMIFSAGASSLSLPSLESGVTHGIVNDVIVLPYNDVPALELALREHGPAIAAVIVEPVCANMGLCLPAPGYLQALRRQTRAHGALLIFDEVITGFRLGTQGAQGEFGVWPDLSCIGKALGGGLPIAAFGGRADIMQMLAPDGSVFVGGTFSGNPACVAAAHAFLDVLDCEPEFFVRLQSRAQQVASGLIEIILRAGLSYPLVQCGSMIDFMFRQGPPHRNLREANEANQDAYARYYHGMLERGILLPPSQMEVMFVTASHTDADIETTLNAARLALS